MTGCANICKARETAINKNTKGRLGTVRVHEILLIREQRVWGNVGAYLCVKGNAPRGVRLNRSAVSGLRVVIQNGPSAFHRC